MVSISPAAAVASSTSIRNMCVYFVSKKCLLLLLGCLITSSLANPYRSSPFKLEDVNSIESAASVVAAGGEQSTDLTTSELDDEAEGVNSAQEDEATNYNSVHIVNQCVTVSMEEGVFYYKSKGTTDTCGLYFISDPDKSIVVTITYLDVQCQQGGLISIVDGWEWNGQLFPSDADHQKRLPDRFHEFCGRSQIRKSFHSSQNAALIQYRIPLFGQGFSVRVQHLVNPRPCNILVQDTEAVYTLQNYGRPLNCSLTTIFDAKIHRLFLSAGLYGSQVNSFTSGFHKTVFHKCGKLGLQDLVQVGGSNGIDTAHMEVVDEFCGYDPNPEPKATTVFCGMTTVRLVSSGNYQNKVVVQVERAGLEDIEQANYICDL